MDSNLLKTKSIEQLVGDAEHGAKALKRTLTAMDLTLLGIGAIIGTGIFVLTGTAAANKAGPAIVLSYVLAGIACALAALCYAEFAAMIPISGSAYTYAYATLGEIFAWMIGWDLILEYAVGSMTVAVGWSGYFQRILAGFGMHLPAWIRRTERRRRGAVVNVPSSIVLIIAHGHRRARSRPLQRLDGAVKNSILFFIVVGVGYVAESWTPFAPTARGRLDRCGGRLLRISADTVSTTAEERRTRAGSADWHHRLAGHLHAAVFAGRRHLERHHPGRAVERSPSTRRSATPWR